jgi:hypothetical protein
MAVTGLHGEATTMHAQSAHGEGVRMHAATGSAAATLQARRIPKRTRVFFLTKQKYRCSGNTILILRPGLHAVQISRQQQ